MPNRSIIGHLFVTSLLLLFLTGLTGLLWMVLFSLRVQFAPFMGGLSLTFMLAWLVVFIATLYADLYHRLNKSENEPTPTK